MKDRDKISLFGKNLRELRLYLDMSQAELAERAGVTTECLSMIETGKREPMLSTIVRILAVIPIKFEALLRE